MADKVYVLSERKPGEKTISELRDDPDELHAALDAMQPAIDRILSRLKQDEDEIRRLVPDYDGSDRSLCKLGGTLARHYPGTRPVDWHDLPVDQLLGYIEAAVDANRGKVDEYSTPMFKGEVAKLYGIKTDALMDRISRKELRVTDVQYRTIRVHLDDLPK